MRDTINPRVKGTGLSKCCQVAEGLDERLLDNIFRLLMVSDVMTHKSEDAVLVSAHELPEGVLVAPQRGLDQCNVGIHAGLIPFAR